MQITDTPYQLIEALEEYLERHPTQKDITVCSSAASIKLGDIASEIRNRTEIGIDYEKSLYKMAFEDLIAGRKKIDISKNES